MDSKEDIKARSLGVGNRNGSLNWLLIKNVRTAVDLCSDIVVIPLEVVAVYVQLLSTPVIWKLARIVYILKPGKDPADPDSYQPPSLLSCQGKIQQILIHTNPCHSYLV